MIRKNLLLCKIFRIKTSSKSLFDSYMAKFQPELETCPTCSSTGNCHIHDYYGRSIIDFRDGKPQKSDLCVMRVFCVTAVSMPTPFFRMSLSLIPATACSSFCAFWDSTLQVVLPSNSSVKDIKSPPSSSISGFLYGKRTSRNGLVFYLIWILLMFLF